MPKTSIEWTDYSWPVLNGCRRKSDGCRHCYAERLAATRLRHTALYKGLAVYVPGKGPQWTGDSRLDAAELLKPLRWRKPRRVFVCDMGDLFYEGNSNEQIAAVFGVMAACPQHTFQVLTKRAKRMAQWFSGLPMDPAWLLAGAADSATGGEVRAPRSDFAWPLPNVHLGVSCEDQPTAEERITLLLKCPAAVWWVSLEPLLSGVDLSPWVFDREVATRRAMFSPAALNREQADATIGYPISWVVVGGESGPGARPYNLAWPRSIIAQCQVAGVPVFHKQLGARPYENSGHSRRDLKLKDRKGGDMSEWPVDLRVREWPEPAQDRNEKAQQKSDRERQGRLFGDA